LFLLKIFAMYGTTEGALKTTEASLRVLFEGKGRMRIALVSLGPGYAKLARLMASHAAVVPGPMLAGFDSRPEPAPPRLPAATVRSLVEADLGPIHTLFSHFDDRPLALTPTAQLHPATLPNGNAVVVKVIRPGLVGHEADQVWAMSLMA